MALHIDCRFNQNSQLQCYLFAILPARYVCILTGNLLDDDFCFCHSCSCLRIHDSMVSHGMYPSTIKHVIQRLTRSQEVQQTYIPFYLYQLLMTRNKEMLTSSATSAKESDFFLQYLLIAVAFLLSSPHVFSNFSFLLCFYSMQEFCELEFKKKSFLTLVFVFLLKIFCTQCMDGQLHITFHLKVLVTNTRLLLLLVWFLFVSRVEHYHFLCSFSILNRFLLSYEIF